VRPYIPFPTSIPCRVCHMVPYGAIWFHMVPYGGSRCHMVPYGGSRCHMVPYGEGRCHMVPSGVFEMWVTILGSSKCVGS
jgi:hypothetical protein